MGGFFPHWYSSGVAVQRDWLTTLPYTSAVYPAIFLRPSPRTCSARTSRAFPLYLLFPPRSYTLKTRGVHAATQPSPPSFCISIRSFRVFFLSIIPLPNPFFQSDSLHPSSSKCQFMRLLFSLSLSAFFLLSSPLFLHFQSTTERLFRVIHRFVPSSPP